jgi:3-deoxy-D-manno-octulosonic-acid transferase
MTAHFQLNLKYILARLSYSLLWALLIPFAMLHFIWQSLRRKPGYTLARLSRFGILFNQQAPTDGILLHCASVGEVVATQTLVEQILNRHPTKTITISTNTTTGADRVSSLFAGNVAHAYLPYDFPLFTWLFIKRLRPSQLIITEMELWPNLCHRCWKLAVPITIINGRMSDKSKTTYQKFPWLFVPMFEKIGTICVQGDRDYTNYLALGVSPEKLRLTNNIKFDLTISDTDLSTSKALTNAFDLQKRLILIAGSTHEPEEQILLDAYLALLDRYPELLLIVVPRHPQRFEKVHQLLKKQDIRVNLMSQTQPCLPTTQVLLCDRMGQLRALYAVADIAFVGGSLAKRGGHNALEPAAVGVPILMGNSTYNNPAICQALHDHRALRYVENSQQIQQVCTEWFDNPQLRKSCGDAGKQVLKQNSGAITKTLEALML